MMPWIFIPCALLAAIALQFLAGWLPLGGQLRQAWHRTFIAFTHEQGEVRGRMLLRLAALSVTCGLILWQSYGVAHSLAQQAVLVMIGFYLLLIAVIDIDHHLVLNRMLLWSLPMLIVLSLLGLLPDLPHALLGSIVGLIIFGLLAAIGRGAMGMGDVKLAGWIGFVLGYPQVFSALLLGIIAGGVAALVLLLLRRISSKQSLAYAPYLALGAWLMLLQQALQAG